MRYVKHPEISIAELITKSDKINKVDSKYVSFYESVCVHVFDPSISGEVHVAKTI